MLLCEYDHKVDWSQNEVINSTSCASDVDCLRMCEQLDAWALARYQHRLVLSSELIIQNCKIGNFPVQFLVSFSLKKEVIGYFLYIYIYNLFISLSFHFSSYQLKWFDFFLMLAAFCRDDLRVLHDFPPDVISRVPTTSRVATAMTRVPMLNLLQHPHQHQCQQPHSMVSSSPMVRTVPMLSPSLPLAFCFCLNSVESHGKQV